ncbi:hypothetical protein PspLS_10845 [Pyricularia sp. CBS 133598]|nr:hypothetical protein PspLS_10845 [Pyricularia sp. CBS 133598]
MAEDRSIALPQHLANSDMPGPPAIEEGRSSRPISPPTEDGHDGRTSRMGDHDVSYDEGEAILSADTPLAPTAVDNTRSSSSLTPADTENASPGSSHPQVETVGAPTGPSMPTINEGEALSSAASKGPHDGTKDTVDRMSSTTQSPLQPLQSNPVMLSTQSSSATLAPPSTSEGRNMLSNRPSAATLVTSANGSSSPPLQAAVLSAGAGAVAMGGQGAAALWAARRGAAGAVGAGTAGLDVGAAGPGNQSPGLGVGVLPAAGGAGAMAGAVAAGKTESGPGFQKADHKTTFKHFLASLFYVLQWSRKSLIIVL